MAGNQAFDDILKNFKGYDSEGNIIIGDENTGEFQALDKGDFQKIYDYAKQNVDQKKRFEDTYSDFQAGQLTKDKKYLGQDNEGNSVFKNSMGVIERAKGSFSEGLKRKFGDVSFNKEQHGQKNIQAGENIARTAPTARTGTGVQSNIAGLQQKQFGTAALAPRQPQQQQDVQSRMQQAFGQGLKSKFGETGRSEPQQSKPKLPQNTQQSTQTPNLTQQVGQVAQKQATGLAKNAAQPYIAQAKSQIKSAAQPYLSKAENYAKQYIPAEAKGMYGQAKGVMDYANLAKDVMSNPQQAAMDYAKNKALGMAQDQLANTALGSMIPGGAGAALGAGKALLGGGNAASKGDAAARAAAQAALAASTGGLSTVVNPETLGMAAGGMKSLKDSKDLNKLGVAGAPLKALAGISSGGLSTAADVGSEAMNLVGKTGADFFGGANQAFKGSKDAIKKITSGNVAEGLKGLGSTALKSVANTLIKQPVSALKNVASSVKNVVSRVFCFAPDTEILMKDGSYKLIQEIKVNDEVALGGTVTAVGTGQGTEFVVINDVHVIDTHALFEDGQWIRAKDSKNITSKYSKPDGIVHPIVTENHLVVTKGQIWADTFEHDNQQDMTREEILKDLNKDKNANTLLIKYLQARGWK